MSENLGTIVDESVERRVRLLQTVTAVSVGATGLVVLAIGWFGGVDILTRLHPSLVSMKANTAAGFILLGIASWSVGDHRRATTARVAALAMTLIGLLTTVEYGFDLDLSIDELLVDDVNPIRTSSPGRMGLNTALCFAMIGVGVIGGTTGTRTGRIIEQAGVACTAFLATLSVAGYVVGVTSTRALGSATEMALHTAVAFVLASIAMLGSICRYGRLQVVYSSFAGGQAMRRLLPAVVGMLMLSVLAVELASGIGLLDETELVLAFLSTLSITVVIGAFVVAAGRLDRADRERHSASAQLIATNGEMEALLRVFSDRHYRLDGEGRVVSQHGDPVAQGAALTARYPTLDLDRVTRQARAASVADGPAATTFRQNGDGGVLTMEARVAALPDSGLAVVVRDVTEQTAARDALAEMNRDLEARVGTRTLELRAANAELERSNRELEQFAYLASHDLKEPLRMVNSFVRKLADRYDDQLDDRGRQYIAFAVDGATRMESLIESILRYSRTGRAEVEAEAVDLGALVGQVVEDLRKQIADADASIRVGSLPWVDGDPTLLSQTFANLIGNAIKFVAPGTPPAVAIAGTLVDGSAEITVDDNGIGIPPEFREQVFSVFKRLHARDAYDGTGIGLAIVHRVIERHNGTIEVTDSPLGGTRFHIRLPAVTAPTP